MIALPMPSDNDLLDAIDAVSKALLAAEEDTSYWAAKLDGFINAGNETFAELTQPWYDSACERENAIRMALITLEQIEVNPRADR